MKKTLITLIAFAGIAAAEGIESWALTLTNGNTSIASGNCDLWAGADNMVLESFLMEYTVDAYASTDFNVTTVITSRGEWASSTERSGITMLTWGKTNVGIGNGKTHYSNPANSMTFSAGDTMRLAFDAETETAYLYNVTQDTLCYVDMSETVTEDNASLYYFTSGVKGTAQTIGASSVWTNGAKDKLTLGNVYDLSSIAGTAQFVTYVKTMTVPEPTTATLSLLALAGLAARRRRRASR